MTEVRKHPGDGTALARGGGAYERMREQMRRWRALPEPQPVPQAPRLADVLRAGAVPEVAAAYERLRGYREAGYTGPLDYNSRIPDPDDPANEEALRAIAALRRHGG